MARKTSIDRLTSDIGRILADYGDDVRGNMTDITDEMARKGAKALRSKAGETFPTAGGHYARDWKAETSGKKRHQVVKWSSVIYNDGHYQLAHLLEHGHVTRNGTGRTYAPTPAHTHIEPVEEELVNAFEREVRAKL